MEWELWVQSKLEWYLVNTRHFPTLYYTLSYFIYQIEIIKETELISWQINKQNPKNKDNKETALKTKQ